MIKRDKHEKNILKHNSPKVKFLKKENVPQKHLERGLVILDIDGTLIDTISGDADKPKYRKRILQFEDDSIYGRPYAKSFIKYLLKKYDVGIWTFATWDYAYEIITTGFDVNPKDLVFFYTRDYPPPFKHSHDKSVKQIDRIPTYHTKRILIDDNIYNVAANEKDQSNPHHRAIKVKEYKVHSMNSASDMELNKIKSLIKHRLGY